MKITEGQLRRIVREELREMKGMSQYGSGPFDPEEGYNDDPSSPMHGRASPHYKELKYRIAASQGSRGYAPPTMSMLRVEWDINAALSDVGAASEEDIFDMLGTKHEPTSIMSALSNMMRKGDIDKDESGAYHIAGFEEYAEDPYEGAAFSKEEIEDIQRGMYGKRR